MTVEQGVAHAAVDGREVIVLAAGVKSQSQPEPVGQREPVVQSIARVHRIVVLGQMARDDVAAIGGDREPDVARARRDPAFDYSRYFEVIG